MQFNFFFARCVVASTLEECEMLASAGFDDICYGYPVAAHHMERNFKLANQLEEYHLMVATVESVEILVNSSTPQGKKWYDGIRFR